ncbi:MAG: THUMP domain-containing protein [Nanoarchaeota archaeon]|nr:hypothetical protein [Nanoarchaeota archaeon]MBU1030605.1 hypothetical protein [Nanoarchaeota archaeon]MBU1849835.1 hypothetical protein [Nanoarchaeota archaeon]
MEFIVRYGEIFLKGKNRKVFENRLITNIYDFLKKERVEGKIFNKRNRLVLDVEKNVNLRKVFGISTYSSSHSCEPDIEQIKKLILSIIKEIKFSDKKSFRVTSKNSDKSIQLCSLDINKEIGSFIVEQTGAKVDLSNPNVNFQIEVFGKKAYVFLDSTICFGGLPVGVEGKVGCLVEDEKSVLSTILVMKRGCMPVLAVKNNYDVSLIEKFAHGFKLKIINVKDFLNIETFFEKNDCVAIITGETLNSCFFESSMPVFRPLIGFSDKQIKTQLKVFSI